MDTYMLWTHIHQYVSSLHWLEPRWSMQSTGRGSIRKCLSKHIYDTKHETVSICVAAHLFCTQDRHYVQYIDITVTCTLTCS